MLRQCNGRDPGLLKEIAHPQTDARQWVLCDCGTEFDDAQRLVIYPHHFIRIDDKRKLEDMVRSGMSAEQIREELTRQPSVNYPTVNQPRSNEGNIMGESSEFRAEEDQNTGYEAPANESGSDAEVSGDANDDEAVTSDEESANVGTFGGAESDRQ